MSIEEILSNAGLSIEQKIEALKQKTITVPVWKGRKGLQSEYEAKMHPVMNKQKYPDIVNDKGIQEVTRVTVDLQKLSVKRMTEMVSGIPVKRVYKPENENQKTIARVLEAIYDRNRIDSFNTERLNMLYAGCEFMTLWYAVEEENDLYGIHSHLKLRCRNFTPMNDDELYPLFDEYGDMVAMSVGYTRKIGKKTVRYFDAYTANKHIKYSDEGGTWSEVENEDITLGKIPAIYVYRPTPIWEDNSCLVYEIEWSLSRNGNYLRENSKPLFGVFADDVISYGNEKGPNEESRSVMQFPASAKAEYITWPQATENLQYHVQTLRNLFFTQLQLPDWNYDKMSQMAMSGESRKQLFIDAQLKVKDESGRLLEGFDRETNVLRAFVSVIMPNFKKDITNLKVEHQITPYIIGDEKETIENLLTANGNKPIMSQRESIERYGKSDDVDQTMLEIAAENKADAFEPTL